MFFDDVAVVILYRGLHFDSLGEKYLFPIYPWKTITDRGVHAMWHTTKGGKTVIDVEITKRVQLSRLHNPEYNITQARSTSSLTSHSWPIDQRVAHPEVGLHPRFFELDGGCFPRDLGYTRLICSHRGKSAQDCADRSWKDDQPLGIGWQPLVWVPWWYRWSGNRLPLCSYLLPATRRTYTIGQWQWQWQWFRGDDLQTKVDRNWG